MTTPTKESRLVAGRYRLLAVLGRGGMGVVWHARDERLGREVAVKEVLLPLQLTDEERDLLCERTLREARTAAKLSHPTVVAVYDVVEEDGRPWVVMELIRSRSLAEVIKEDGPLTPERTAEIGVQVLGALRIAHAAGILHRDVKPSNVLLAENGRVVLTDFGIARLEGDPSLTKSGMLLGAPAYIAPERARGLAAGPESDLWSLGATLYTAVEGQAPHDRGSPMPTLTAVVTEEPDPAHRAGPLKPVLTGLLRKDPQERLGPAEVERMLREVVDTTARRPALPAAMPSASTPAASTPTASAPAASAPAAKTPAASTPTAPAPAASTPTASAPAGPSATPALSESSAPPASPAPSTPPEPDRARPHEPPETGTGPGRRRSRRTVAALAAAVLLAAGGVAGWAALVQARDRGAEPDARSSPSPGSASRAPTGSGSPTTGGTGTPGAGPGTATQTGAPATASPGGKPGAVAAGFRRYQDPTGFSLAVPQGWTREQRGHLVYFREPGGGRFMFIDQRNDPQPDPAADWRRQEAARRSTYRDYQRIRIESVPNFHRAAADWEFVYTAGGERRHVQIRGLVAHEQKAYGIYWSTPDRQWSQSLGLLRVVYDTFQAPPRQAS